MRLLSPCSKTNDSFNDKNTAVGKGKSLARTINWLNKDHFSKKRVSLIRDRFFERMGPLMPPRESGVYWHLLLPESFGGIGMMRPDDTPDLLARLPEPTKALILSMAKDQCDKDTLDLFKGFTRNKSYRGYAMLNSEKDLIKETLTMTLPYLTPMLFKEALKGYSIPESSIQLQLKQLKKKGWVTLEYLEDIVTRPFLFKEILSRETKTNVFDTIPFKRRYAQLWNLTYKGDVVITNDDLQKALKYRVPFELYDINERMSMPFRGTTVTVNPVEEALLGLPDLSIPKALVTILSSSKRRRENSETEVQAKRPCTEVQSAQDS